MSNQPPNWPQGSGQHNPPAANWPQGSGQHVPPPTNWSQGSGQHSSPAPNWPQGVGQHGPPRPNLPQGSGQHGPPRPNWPQGPGQHRPPVANWPQGSGQHRPPVANWPQSSGQHGPPVANWPQGSGQHGPPGLNLPQGTGQYAPPAANTGVPRNPYPAHMQSAPQPAAPQGALSRKHRRIPSEDDYGNPLTVPANHPLILRRKRSRINPPETPPPPLLTPSFPSQHLVTFDDIKRSTYPNATRWSTPNQPFNIFHALLRHPHVFFEFAKRLDPDTFIDLFALCQEFNHRVTQNMTSVMQDYASYHAPDCAYYFTWKLFPELCIKDPTNRPLPGRPHLARTVPSFRWAQMVRHRGIVIRRILTLLSLEGHRVPAGTQLMLTKYWLLMDLKTQALRRKVLADRSVWSDDELVMFCLFKFKLDMRIGHPIRGMGAGRLSVLMLSQRGLEFLDGFLRGEIGIDRPFLFSMMLRTYQTADLNTVTYPDFANQNVNGVPRRLWGRLTRENHDPTMPVMQTPLVLVVKEAIRRHLCVWNYFIDFVLYGFGKPGTGENEPHPMVITERVMGKVRKVVCCDEKGWPTEKVVKGRLKDWGLEDM